MEQIIKAFCETKNIKYDDLISCSRKQPLALYRQCLMWTFRKYNMKVIYIAALFNRHHSSVTAAIKKVDYFLSINDSQTMKTLRSIKTLE